jgi:hypothetical protein
VHEYRIRFASPLLMRTDMNLEQKNGATAATQDVLTHHLNCFGKGHLAGTMADYAAESRLEATAPPTIKQCCEAFR